MRYDDFDIPTMERDAFRRGDAHTAALLAAFEDRTEDDAQQLSDMEKERDAAMQQAEEAEERTRELERQLNDAYRLVESAARVSNRAEILKALLP